jgi:hypothetical protein
VLMVSAVEDQEHPDDRVCDHVWGRSFVAQNYPPLRTRRSLKQDMVGIRSTRPVPHFLHELRVRKLNAHLSRRSPDHMTNAPSPAVIKRQLENTRYRTRRRKFEASPQQRYITNCEARKVVTYDFI